MVAVALDTHRVVKRLRDAGFSDSQAETVTDVLTEATRTSLADFATNARIDSLEQRIDTRFEQLDQRLHGMEERYDGKLESLEQRVNARVDSLEQRMNGRFESLEQRMTIKLGSMLVAGVALIAVLVKLL